MLFRSRLAADRDALLRLRRELRPRLQASPLTDVPRFVRDLEAAYRQMRSAAEVSAPRP